LPREKRLLILTSTYGDGEPPDNAADFHEFLLDDAAPQLPGVDYAVFALGDSSYPDFCQCGIDFDKRLSALGAKCICDRVDADVEFDEAFSAWEATILTCLAAPVSA
jgi:sulfite reductase (NADPH) flavoprotein alpha-component